MGGEGREELTCGPRGYILVRGLSCMCTFWFLEAGCPGARCIALARCLTMPPSGSACETCIGAPCRARWRLYSHFSRLGGHRQQTRGCAVGELSRGYLLGRPVFEVPHTRTVTGERTVQSFVVGVPVDRPTIHSATSSSTHAMPRAYKPNHRMPHACASSSQRPRGTTRSWYWSGDDCERVGKHLAWQLKSWLWLLHQSPQQPPVVLVSLRARDLRQRS